jgi:hypothetical protein
MVRTQGFPTLLSLVLKVTECRENAAKSVTEGQETGACFQLLLSSAWY